MPDREKVIKTIDGCINDDSFCNKCDYEGCVFRHGSCEKDLLADALALLKEQEAVKPKYNARSNWYECGSCHFSMTSGMHCKGELIPAYKVGFCAKCGKAVKWE